MGGRPRLNLLSPLQANPTPAVVDVRRRDVAHSFVVAPVVVVVHDSFSVPDAAREEFEQTMRRNLAFMGTLPGFLGHVAFEKAGGPATFNVVTMAVWESKQAFDGAAEEVRAYYGRIGFDMPAMLAQWGVKAELGNFTAMRETE